MGFPKRLKTKPTGHFEYRQRNLVEDEETLHPLQDNFVEMDKIDMAFWLCKFVTEARRQDKEPYPPDTLYSLCCSLVRKAIVQMWSHLKILYLQCASYPDCVCRFFVVFCFFLWFIVYVGTCLYTCTTALLIGSSWCLTQVSIWDTWGILRAIKDLINTSTSKLEYS